MPKQKHRPPQQLDSLIPTIKTEEKRLDDLLAEARAQAQRMVRDAQEQAAARIASARQSLPGLLRKEREARRAEMEKKATDAAAREEAAARETEQRAGAAMARTVEYIVSMVWPPHAARRRDGGAAQ